MVRFGTLLLVALALAVGPGRIAGARERQGAANTAQEPYANVLSKLVKDWPADLEVEYLRSSGGIPPYVTRWRVAANGVGKVERSFDDAGHLNPESWPVALQVVDLKALLMALCAVDFEHVRRPVPDSPVQFLSVTSGGRTEFLDTNGLAISGTLPGVQEAVGVALSRLLEQASKAKLVRPAP